jgi:hypothetical protein
MPDRPVANRPRSTLRLGRRAGQFRVRPDGVLIDQFDQGIGIGVQAARRRLKALIIAIVTTLPLIAVLQLRRIPRRRTCCKTGVRGRPHRMEQWHDRDFARSLGGKALQISGSSSGSTGQSDEEERWPHPGWTSARSWASSWRKRTSTCSVKGPGARPGPDGDRGQLPDRGDALRADELAHRLSQRVPHPDLGHAGRHNSLLNTSMPMLTVAERVVARSVGGLAICQQATRCGHELLRRLARIHAARALCGMPSTKRSRTSHWRWRPPTPRRRRYDRSTLPRTPR